MKTLQGAFAHNEILILGAVRYGRISRYDDEDRPKLLGVHRQWKYHTFSLAELIINNEAEHATKLRRIEKERKEKRKSMAVCIDMTEQEKPAHFEDVLDFAKTNDIPWELIMEVARENKVTVEEVINIMKGRQ